MTKESVTPGVFFRKNSIRTILIYMAIIFAINFVVFLLINSISFIHYQTSDDFTLQNLINGSLGGYYYDFPSTNFLLLKFISAFYQLTDAVNWYGLFELFLLFLTASFIGAILMDKFGPKVGVVLYLLTLPIYFGLFLTQFQFTVISYSLLAASIAGTIYAFYTEQKGTKMFLNIFSICAFVLAALFRNEVIVSAAVYFGVCAFLLLIYYKKKSLKFIIVAAVAFLICGGAFLMQNNYYNSSRELKDYEQFNSARVQLVDRAPLAYDSNADTFQMLGWTRNDTNVFRGYTYPDDEKFNTLNLETIAAARSNVQYMTDTKAILSNLFATFTESNTYMLLCLFVVFLLAFLSGKRKTLSVLLLLLPFAIQMLLVIIWRPAFRAVYPHYILSIIALLSIIDFENLKTKLGFSGHPQKKTIIRIASACMIAVFGVAMGNLLLHTKWDGDVVSSSVVSQERKLAFDYFNQNPGNVYLYSVQSSLIAVNESYSIFETFPKDYFINNRLFGGWDTRSPSYNDFKERNGLQILPRDLLKDNVYFVSGTSLDQLTQYFNQNYGMSIQYQVIQKLSDQIIVYKIQTTDADHMGQIEPAVK